MARAGSCVSLALALVLFFNCCCGPATAAWHTRFSAAAGAAAGQPGAGARGRTTGPVQRVIVPDLTQHLGEQLEQAGVSLLIVLPGGDAAAATGPGEGWSLDFDALSSKGPAKGVHVRFVRSYPQFIDQWHAYFRELNLRKKQQPGGVALLLRGSAGSSGLGQAALAAAVTRHLRQHWHALTLAYSTHQDKGDTLVSFSPSGEPLAAAFLSTQIFRDAFTKIYDTNTWSGGGGSGHGSDLGWTVKLRQELPKLLLRYNISSMLDSSCGSMHWMPLVLGNATSANPRFKFMGTDVACNLIERHKAQWPQWSFACVDYSNQPLPSGYELVFSRDSLQHLPMHGAWQFLNNVRNSGARYLLVGSYVKSSSANGDIAKAGEYYDIDLLKPPFSVSRPLEIVDEETEDGKHLLLFDVPSMSWHDPLHGLV